MKLNHLAICARDVAASQDFYCTYFGFRQGPGPGLLASEDGFALAIVLLPRPGGSPDVAVVHLGLMRVGDDHRGFLVEVRGMGAPDAAPAP